MFHKTTLKNGLRIITTPLKNTRAITLLVLIATGSKYEKREINGISHLLEHMAFKGTRRRPETHDIAKELDKVGGIFNAFTGKEYMGFWVKVDAKHLDLSCDILSDMLFHSLLKKQEMEKEKKVVIEEINMMNDNPQSYVLELWEQLLYGDQPAGWMIAGDRQSVNRISREDLVNQFKSHFVSKNAVISLAGNFENKKAVSKIKKYFDNFREKEPVLKPQVFERQNSPQVLLNFKETDQTHLCLGARAFDLFSPKKYPLALMAGILGGIMSSRLFIKVREKKALGYYIRTAPEQYTDSGYLVTHAGIDNKRVPEAIKIILKEYKDLRTKKVSRGELSKIKDNIKGHIYLGLETSDAWASYTGLQEILKGKISTPDEECALIEKVTQSDILKVAQEVFQPQKMNLSLIGPFKEEKKFLKLLKTFN